MLLADTRGTEADEKGKLTYGNHLVVANEPGRHTRHRSKCSEMLMLLAISNGYTQYTIIRTNDRMYDNTATNMDRQRQTDYAVKSRDRYLSGPLRPDP